MPDPATPGVSRRRALPRWHPNADEWQYVVEGEVSVHPVRLSRSLPDPRDCRRATSVTSRRATGQSIYVSSGPARVLIGFNETIDLSQWIAANSRDVLATNFGQPAEVFGKFPDRDVFIAGKDGT
jgi:oxalate decarboxylase